MLNEAHIQGEPDTGYENEEGKGEFSCRNCQFYQRASSSCGQKDMMAKSNRPRTDNGRVRVEAKGCCEYVDRMGLVFLD